MIVARTVYPLARPLRSLAVPNAPAVDANTVYVSPAPLHHVALASYQGMQLFGGHRW